MRTLTKSVSIDFACIIKVQRHLCCVHSLFYIEKLCEMSTGRRRHYDGFEQCGLCTELNAIFFIIHFILMRFNCGTHPNIFGINCAPISYGDVCESALTTICHVIHYKFFIREYQQRLLRYKLFAFQTSGNSSKIDSVTPPTIISFDHVIMF